MAATHTLNSYTYDGRYLQVSLTQTKDAANRRSKITGTVTSLAGASTWYSTGPTTVTVAGTQRYSRVRESGGTGQSNKNFAGTISEFYVSHDTAGKASVTVSITTAIYASATQTTSNTWTLDNIGAATSACGASTACSVNQTVAESNVTLSWSGATSGTNNAVSSYEIQYSESTNNSTWGTWTALTTVNSTAGNGSISVAPPTTRGNFRRFQVRTRGAAGASYYSGWKISTNSVRKNTWPIMSTAVTASPSVYSGETITLTWSGASGGTSAIKGYMIASRTSPDNATWTSWSVLATINLAASSGSYAPTVSRTPGTYTQFGVWTIDTLDVYSGEKISSSIYCNITAAGVPTSCSLSTTLAEGNVTLSWAGASSGAGNAITSYEVQYSDSSDAAAWGEWTALSLVTTAATFGSVSVSPPTIRGNYRRFQVRTCGSAGSAYYSGWIISSNYVRKNILATPPQSVNASPAVYNGNQVTVAWSGVSPGTSAIKQYVIQESVSGDHQSTWSSWETAATVISSGTSGSTAISASTVPRTYTRYRIAVTDALGGMTAYILSNVVLKNSPPPVPLVEAPKTGSVTYNSKPMYLIQTQTEPDGTAQTVWVHSANGTWYNNADNPDCFTSPGATAESVKTIFSEQNSVEPSSCTVTIQCRDEYSTGISVSRSFTIAPSPFEEITANETYVKAAHIQTLRTAANNLRNYYNLPPYVWASEIVPGKTQVRDWPFHILELRAAIQGVIDKINSFDGASDENKVPPVDWIDLGTGRPRADVVNQLIDLILQL